MQKYVVFSMSLFLSACSFNPWSSGPSKRELASLSLQTMTQEDRESYSEEVESKLDVLHTYYMLGQKHMHSFDAIIEETPIEDLYQTEAYLKLLAVRTQAEEVEHEIIEAYQELSVSKSAKSKMKMALMSQNMMGFMANSKAKRSSLENLSRHLNFQGLENPDLSLSNKDVENEIKNLQEKPEFSIYEKNIEHIAFMMKVNIEENNKRFYPSQTKAGLLTGNEFPAKVWSLTFDDGPNKTSTEKILKSLQEKNLKATFFQLTKMAKSNEVMAKKISSAGMEIASHSYSHKQLTKVGAQTLEYEVTTAIKDLEKIHGRKMRFYRLPYGAGVNTASIRQKIAANGAIHVFWNIDTLDWMSQTPDKIVERTISLMKKTKNDAGILLFHDIHERTALATPRIMDYLNKDARRVCTLAEIVDQMNEGAEVVCPKE